MEEEGDGIDVGQKEVWLYVKKKGKVGRNMVGWEIPHEKGETKREPKLIQLRG